MSALSDSTTSTDSPRSTLSPGFLSHSTIFPSVMVEERAGIKISWVAKVLSPPGIRGVIPAPEAPQSCDFKTPAR